MLGYDPPTPPPPEQTPPGSRPPSRADPPEQTPQSRPPGSRTPPPPSKLRHTVNERPVRILLECILVFCPFRFRSLSLGVNKPLHLSICFTCRSWATENKCFGDNSVPEFLVMVSCEARTDDVVSIEHWCSERLHAGPRSLYHWHFQGSRSAFVPTVHFAGKCPYKKYLVTWTEIKDSTKAKNK